MGGKEKIKRLEKDMLEIKAHLQLAKEKLHKLSSNHRLSGRIEENIILFLYGPIEQMLEEEIDSVAGNINIITRRERDAIKRVIVNDIVR